MLYTLFLKPQNRTHPLAISDILNQNLVSPVGSVLRLQVLQRKNVRRITLSAQEAGMTSLWKK